MSTEDSRNRLRQLETLLSRVAAMRELQRSYFATRTREKLSEAKLSETRVDALIRELGNEKHDLFG